MNAQAKPFQPFTSAEFHRMVGRGAFSDMRVELRRGMIVKMSPKHLPHVQVQADLTAAFVLAIRKQGLGWKVGGDATVSFGQGFDPEGDIVLYDPALTAEMSGPLLPAAVKLIVEVSDSSLADDLGDKLEDYARGGLAEYWVVNVKTRTVHLHADPVGVVFTRSDTAPLIGGIGLLTQPLAIEVEG